VLRLVTTDGDSDEIARQILGAILINNNALERVRRTIDTHDFEIQIHRVIFDAMKNLASRHEEIDIISVSEELDASAALAIYIGSLIDGIPDVANVETTARRMKTLTLH
jgi:replicative DNA helicase